MDSFSFRNRPDRLERHLHKVKQVEKLECQIAPMRKKQTELNKPIHRALGYKRRFEEQLAIASNSQKDLKDRKNSLDNLQTLGREIKNAEAGMQFLTSQTIDNYNIYGFHILVQYYDRKFTESMPSSKNGEVSDQDRAMLEKLIQVSEDAASSAERDIGSHQGFEASKTIARAPKNAREAIRSYYQTVVDKLCFLIVWSEAGQARRDLQAQTSPLQEKWEAISEAIDKHPFLGPVRQELNRLKTSSEVSPSESSSNRLLQQNTITEFFNYFDTIENTLKNAHALLRGQNIYADTKDCLQDNGEKARNKLLGMSRDLEGTPEKLNRAFEKVNICSHREKISEVFESMKDVLLYGASHLEKIPLEDNQYEEIYSTLDSIREKYFPESHDSSDSSDSSVNELLQPAEGEEDLLRSLKQCLSEMESDDQSLLWIKQRFLQHEGQKLENFFSDCNNLLTRWTDPKEETKKAFGEDMYNSTMQDLTDIAARIDPSKATSLKLGELPVLAKDKERIEAIEVNLMRKMLYESRYPEENGKPLPTSLADFPPHERRDNVLNFINFREADVSWVPDGSPCTADDITQMKMRTVCFVLKGLEREKLTSNYYRQLYDICANDTFTVTYDNIKNSVDKGYIKNSVDKGYIKNSVDKGYRGIRFTKLYGDIRIYLFGYGLLNEWYSKEGFEELCQNYDCRKGSDPRYGDQGHPVGRTLRDDPREMSASGKLLFNPFTEKECEAHANCIFDQYYKDIRQARHEIMLDRHHQEGWTWDFVKRLSEDEIKKVLTPIAHCCRELELSHLFWDYNGRLAGFIIPFKLCIENHLVPPIISPDPWVLDRGSSKEIVQKFLEGQKKTSEYMF